MPDNQKQSKLAEILKAMVDSAEISPGDPQRRELSSGLRIDFIYGSDSVYRLQLSREKVYPSETEWTTVINHFPQESVMYIFPPAPIERFTHKGRCYFRSFWDVSEKGS